MKRLFRLCGMAIGIWLTMISVSCAEEVIKIKIPTHFTPNYKDIFPEMQRFINRINELAKGRAEAKLYHSETLFKAKDIVPALMNGGCEVAFHVSSYTVDVWPEAGGLGLPFLYKDETDCKNCWMTGKPVFELVNKEMERKYGVRILASGISKGLMIATRKKSIEKFEDLKGLKFRSVGKLDGEYLKACGAVAVMLSSSDTDQALRRGALDGIVSYTGTITARNLDDVLENISEMNPLFGNWGTQIYVLTKTFNSWSKEVQDAVLQAAKEYDEHFTENSLEYYNKEILPRLQKKMKIISPNADEMKKFVEAAQKVHQDWSNSVDKEFAKKFIELSQN